MQNIIRVRLFMISLPSTATLSCFRAEARICISAQLRGRPHVQVLCQQRRRDAHLNTLTGCI